ncbi:hypothetical protein Lesp02_29600 [Lentzea sp. NBRC 105346]|nr:hypothetical protein Lesp02_29600 [Lentzea sp. NBRC 105346]
MRGRLFLLGAPPRTPAQLKEGPSRWSGFVVGCVGVVCPSRRIAPEAAASETPGQAKSVLDLGSRMRQGFACDATGGAHHLVVVRAGARGGGSLRIASRTFAGRES